MKAEADRDSFTLTKDEYLIEVRYEGSGSVSQMTMEVVNKKMRKTYLVKVSQYSIMLDPTLGRIYSTPLSLFHGICKNFEDIYVYDQTFIQIQLKAIEGYSFQIKFYLSKANMAADVSQILSSRCKSNLARNLTHVEALKEIQDLKSLISTQDEQLAKLRAESSKKIETLTRENEQLKSTITSLHFNMDKYQSNRLLSPLSPLSPKKPYILQKSYVIQQIPDFQLEQGSHPLEKQHQSYQETKPQHITLKYFNAHFYHSINHCFSIEEENSQYLQMLVEEGWQTFIFRDQFMPRNTYSLDIQLMCSEKCEIVLGVATENDLDQPNSVCRIGLNASSGEIWADRECVYKAEVEAKQGDVIRMEVDLQKWRITWFNKREKAEYFHLGWVNIDFDYQHKELFPAISMLSNMDVLRIMQE